ncbi:unnamed protein product [Effrenium voratum]|nr:unnamed protein product [Effrenium voratum]
MRSQGRWLAALALALATSQVGWTLPAWPQPRPCERARVESGRSGRLEPQTSFLSQAPLLLALALLLPLPVAALAPQADFPDGNPVAKDLRLPPLPAEEMQRRRTAPMDVLKTEKWYKQGKRAFESNCSGCHPISRSVNLRNQRISF